MRLKIPGELQEMPGISSKKPFFKTYAPPWMIVGATVILLGVVVTLAVRNIHREARYMSTILSEKGGALIKSFEAGARTGMMGMMWGGAEVQNLLEQVALQPGIRYLVVADRQGKILAHNDPDQVGGQFLDPQSMQKLDPGDRAQWRIVDHPARKRSFMVYRNFRPLQDKGSLGRETPGRGPMCPPGTVNNRRRSWCFPSPRPQDTPVIFVGLDVAPFEAAREEDVRNTLILSAVLVLLGLGGFLSMFLTQRYQATRRELQDTSAFADEVVSNLPVGLMATDSRNRITFLNEAAEKITGLTRDRILGSTPVQVFPSSLHPLIRCLENGDVVLEEETEWRVRGRAPVPVSVSATVIVNEAGSFVGNLFMVRDLGEVRRLQEEIRRKEKMAAVGGLAAGVAHEIRNPLSSIQGLASFFKNKYGQQDEDREAADIMVREVERLNRVISELLDFARPSRLKPKPADINEVLAHSVRLIEQDARARGIQVRLSPQPGLPLGLVDPDRLSQCLINLFLNSIQAMDSGGVLSVRSLLHGQKELAIEVEDTGRGIDPEDVEKIFEPYFTTKSSGTGLGLAVVHKIMESHKGDIKVRSTPEKGTLFTLILPAAEDICQKGAQRVEKQGRRPHRR
ncbi:MAG: ATP-binding protein [Desulfobacteraceae bacterium]